MNFSLLETVVLKHDLAEHGLCAGDLGAIVEVYDHEAFEVEFVTTSGRTQALVTLRAQDLRAADDADLVSVRSLVRGAA